MACDMTIILPQSARRMSLGRSDIPQIRLTKIEEKDINFSSANYLPLLTNGYLHDNQCQNR